jgi:GMP synthase-like glutamine amidotransferase
MAIVVFEHHAMETSARLGQVLRDHGHKLRVVRLYAGDAIPADLDDVDGVVSMGGTMNVDQAGEFPWIDKECAFIKAAHEAKLPVVGVCLGAQLIAHALGGKVAKMDTPEIGWGKVSQFKPGFPDTIFGGIPWKADQFHAHGQQVTDLPPGGVMLASTKACKNQAFRVGLTTYAFQYHFEWTRSDIDGVLTQFANWISESGGDAEAIRSETADKYDTYRRLGDKLCETLASMVFCIEHRLSHTKGPAANFDASQS